MVVSSPTGSGKTVVFELSIIRMLEASEYGKAVYLAPTKALCGERFKDWSAKFAGIGIKCTSIPLLAFLPGFESKLLLGRRGDHERYALGRSVVQAAGGREDHHHHAREIRLDHSMVRPTFDPLSDRQELKKVAILQEE